MKILFTKEEFEKHLEKLKEIEIKQKPFKDWLIEMNSEFIDFITNKYTKRTANKHGFIIECFIDFITYDLKIMDIQEITKGVTNTYFQQWFTQKIGMNTKEEVKVAINKFIDYLAIEKGIVIKNLQNKSKRTIE
jgi:hypothetical protein